MQSIAELLGKDWSTEGLLTLVPDKFKPLLVAVASPLPPSGLAALVPSFKRIPRDVCYIGNIIFRIGGAPGEMVHAIEYKAGNRTRIGIPLERPVGDSIKVRTPARDVPAPIGATRSVGTSLASLASSAPARATLSMRTRTHFTHTSVCAC